MKAYLAGPIFTERDRNFNSYLEEEILKRCPDLDLYLSQNNKSINDKSGCATSADIYVGDVTRLRESDIVITIMSGDLPPIGSSYEVAYFCALCEQDPKKRIIALYDDSREGMRTYSDAKCNAMRAGVAESQWSYINLLSVGFVKKWGTICTSSAELIDTVAKEYEIGCEKIISGIYKITNLKTNLCYIGQSVDIYTCWRAHRNSKDDLLLHQDIQKYGLDYFKWEILERCPEERLTERENYWINYYDSYNNGYNAFSSVAAGAVISDQCVPVYCYDLDGNFVKEYHSGSAAARDMQISMGNLWRTINYDDSKHTCQGYMWRRYKVDHVEPYQKTENTEGQIYAYDIMTREFVQAYPSRTEAGIQLTGKKQPHISDVLAGKRASCCGFLWAEEYFDCLPLNYYTNREELGL